MGLRALRFFIAILFLQGTASARPPSLPDVIDQVSSAVFQVRRSVKSAWAWKTTTGTAILVAPGYLLTAHHVVQNADAIGIVVGGEEKPARVVAESAADDLALLRADVSAGRTPLAPAVGYRYRLGTGVIVIGYPFGYSVSVSRGIVSGLIRTIHFAGRDHSVVQTDAAVNSGNSGGPLVARDGKWIGVVIAVRDDACGIAFAVPIDPVAKFLEKNLPVRR